MQGHLVDIKKFIKILYNIFFTLVHSFKSQIDQP